MINNYRNISLTSNAVFYSLLLDKDTQYYLQKFQLPTINLNGQDIQHSSGTLTLNGEVQKFGDLNISVLIDENLKIYKNIINSFNSTNKVGTSYSAINEANSWIQIYDNNNNYIMKVEFYNSKIDGIGTLEWSSTENNVLTLEITIKLDYMKIINN